MAGADKEPRRRRRWPWYAAAGLVVLLAIVGWTPVLDADLSGDPDPTTDYAQAIAGAEALRALDGDDVAERCRSRIIDHGAPTEHAVVLLHGYTNCPAQFDLFAQAYASDGVSVVVPRLPAHGKADRLTDELSDLTPGQLTATTDAAVDIAAGLGDNVTVVGLSGGGTAAAWAAATRDDVDEAVLIAPLVVPKILPRWLVDPVARFSRFTPDVHLWWDSDQKDALDDPPYAYPRYSVRSLGAFLGMGHAISEELDRSRPLDLIVVITNDADNAVNNAGVLTVGSVLEDVAVERFDHRFTADLGYGHDLVDPEGENAADIDEIYATLAEVIDLPGLAEVTDASSG